MALIRRLCIAAVMMAAMMLGGSPAFATEPLTTSGYVTDPDGFLSAEQRGMIETSAQSFYSAYSMYIDVSIVPTFSDQKPSTWCRTTLMQSRTADKGILYVLAYEDGTDTFCTDSNLEQKAASDPMTKKMLDDALGVARGKHTSTPLTPDEAAAGARAFIDDVRSTTDIHARIAADSRKRQQEAEEERKREAERSLGGYVFLAVVVVIAVVSNLWVALRGENDHDDSSTDSGASVPIVDPVRREALRAADAASRRLSEAAEQVRAAEEDWNFARAQFGSAAAEEYGRRLEAAKEAVARGRDTHTQICRTVDSLAKKRLAATITKDLDEVLPPLEKTRAEFAARRRERSTLPAQLSEARERLVEELADLERSKEELSSIAGLYPDSMLASLQDNPQRAAAFLESARSALDTASAHIEADPTRAASALDTAQRALSMANAQTDAIFSAKTDLDTFREKLAASIGSVSQALSDAKRLDFASASFAPLLDEAEAAISQGQRALVSDEDPLGALENLRDVELRMDAILAPLMTQK